MVGQIVRWSTVLHTWVGWDRCLKSGGEANSALQGIDCYGADSGPSLNGPCWSAFRPSATIAGRSAFDRPRPISALRDRSYERAVKARKRSSAEGDCVDSGDRAPVRHHQSLICIQARASAAGPLTSTSLRDRYDGRIAAHVGSGLFDAAWLACRVARLWRSRGVVCPRFRRASP